MKFSLRKALLLSLLIGILSLTTVVIIALNRPPRTHLSQTLKFLKGYEPVRSKLVPQGYRHRDKASGTWREAVALIEEFELPMSFWEAHVLSRNELKSIAYTVTFDQAGHPPSSLYGVTDKAIKENLVVIVSGLSPTKSQIMFKQTIEPSWLDQMFEWIRSGFSGRKLADKP